MSSAVMLQDFTSTQRKNTDHRQDADGRSGAPVECGLVDLLFPINKKLWTALCSPYRGDRSLRIVFAVFIMTLRKKELDYFFEVFGRKTTIHLLLSEVFVIILYSIPGWRTNLCPDGST